MNGGSFCFFVYRTDSNEFLNAFSALTNDYIPAVVLFSVGFGIALMAIPNRKLLLDNLEIVVDGLGRLNRMVVNAAPIGMFAIVAEAAGTFSPVQFQLLQGYLIVYGAASLLLSLWIFPLLISCLRQRLASFLSFVRL